MSIVWNQSTRILPVPFNTAIMVLPFSRFAAIVAMSKNWRKVYWRAISKRTPRNMDFMSKPPR